MTDAVLDPVAEATANQKAAADPGYSVFVTANAGSGKTKVLVDRIARLLLEDVKPSAFLCITYTKAAAAEMQRRLFERLGGWCVADDETLSGELQKLGAPSAGLQRARALFARALETPGGLKIQTIHAFCERLLARFPIEAGVAPGFDIADEARAAALLGQARADAALADDAPREAFRRFAAKLHAEGLEALFDRLALRRADFHRYNNLHRSGEGTPNWLRKRHGAVGNAEELTRSFIAGVDWQSLRDAAEKLSEGSSKDQSVAEALARAIDCGLNASPDTLAACFAFAFTDKGKGDMRKDYVTKKTEDLHPWLEPRVRAFADLCDQTRNRLRSIERAEDAVAALALALKLDQAYADAKTRAGALDFDDLIEHAQALLQQSEAAPWVLYKLDGGLDHILIDEGQDTSPAQWDLIKPLQNEFFAGAGARGKPRTVFSVGDPKQSIYGFQGADPERFLEEAQDLAQRAAATGKLFRAPGLRTSFRSAPEILRAVDATMKNKPLIAGPSAADIVTHLASRGGQGGVVEVWPWTPRPVAVESKPWDAPIDIQTGVTAPAKLAAELAKRIKAMIDAREAVWDEDTKEKRPMRPGDVLALVRTRGAMFKELIKAFKRAGLPVAGADRMVLRDELAVEDCLALMRVALDPADDLALACVLKGPWCGLIDDDKDLFPLAYGRAREETLMQKLMASKDKRYAAAKAFVAELSARKGADPFAFLSWALETPHGGGPTGWMRVFSRLGPETRDPLQELLQRALKAPHHVAPTLQRFLYDVEVDAGQVKRELEAESGAVRVMTVHGAKGLEAPVVLLPDSTGGPDDAPDNGIIFDGDHGPFVSFRKSDDDPIVAAARAEHIARVEREHWRLLYVAMTRARDRLIVCGPQHGGSKAGEDEHSWRLAVHTALEGLGADKIDTEYGAGLRIGKPERAEALAASVAETAATLPSWARAHAADTHTQTIAAPSRLVRIDPALFSPRGDGQKRFRRGRMIHGLLERLPDVAPEQRRDAALAWLERQGAEEDLRGAYTDEALKVIDDPRFSSVFGPSSRAEAPIVGIVNGRPVSGVVDRLAVDAESVTVLDFKTDRPAPTDVAKAPEPYVLQLALYRAVLGKIFPGRTIRCALLWTEAPHLMELPQTTLDAALASFPRG